MHHVVHQLLPSFGGPVAPLLSSLIPAPLLSAQTLRHEFSAFYETRKTRERTHSEEVSLVLSLSHITVMSTFPALLGYCKEVLKEHENNRSGFLVILVQQNKKRRVREKNVTLEL